MIDTAVCRPSWACQWPIPPPRWQHPALTSEIPLLRAAAERAWQLGEANGWSRSTTRCAIDGLVVLLDGRPDGERVTLTEIRGRKPRDASAPRVAEVLAAREFETGTFRLAWTQGSTRTRWLAVKLAVAGAASIAVAGLLSLMVTWWSSPIAAAQTIARLDPRIFNGSGIAPVGYAAFAFACGATAGLLGRRTLPAMVVTLAIFVAVVWFAFPVWVRPHLLPSAQATAPLSTGSLMGFELVGNGRLLVQTSPPDLPGAWVLSTQLITPAGRPASTVPATPACTSRSSGQTCPAYVQSLHLRQTVTYQPASRYWPLQWYETGIYLALALALAGLCLWWIRPGHFTGLNTRHRTSQPTPALQCSQ